MSQQTVYSADTGADALLTAAAALRADAKACRQRRMLVLSGERDASVALAERIGKTLELPLHWYSDQVPDAATGCFGRAAFDLLGSEIDALVFDAFAGFDPDAFGALGGSVRAGGLLLLIIPPLADWPRFNDPQNARITVAPFAPDEISGRFLQRLARLLQSDATSLLVESGQLIRVPEAVAPPQPSPDQTAFTEPCRTPDQQRAVAAVMKVATGHRRRPVVLTSDRGRGKSAAFGIAAAQLVQQGKRRIIITAPSRQAAGSLLEQAERVLPGAADCMCFVAPDELVQKRPSADLVLVDEAAAIPTPLLEQLLKSYARIAFASTVHGYEGTGRGFALRFTRILDRLSNSWKMLELRTPIRWTVGDPVESLLFTLLALDAEPADEALLGVAGASQTFTLERIDRDQLIQDERTLAELFGLLVQAHYRTRPLDLRHLLDGPNLDIYVLRAGGHVAATALLATEGGFDETTAEAIWAGRHRPHGHLLPETLAAHQGLREAPTLRCGRIMRVTVHPALRRRGLGSRLVNEIADGLEGRGYDLIGTSFGASVELLDFWLNLNWLPVRLSIQKSASSGSHSAVFIRAFTARAVALQNKARQRFFAQFPHQLSDSLRELDPAVAAALFVHAGAYAPVIDEDDLADLRAFAEEQRLTEVTIGSLWRLALQALMTGQAERRLDPDELTLLLVRVLQKRDWSECAERVGLSGRKQALSQLRKAVRKLQR